MDYGKIENEWSVAREEAANEQEAAMLERDGFLPIGPTPEKPGEGYARRYDVSLDGKSIVVSWAIPPQPPRSLSKRKLYNALKARGLWAGVKQYLEAKDLWDDFALATTLDEDDPLIKEAIGALKAALSLTDEDVERILEASVAEGGSV